MAEDQIKRFERWQRGLALPPGARETSLWLVKVT
jgi:hypothetical protein